MPHPMRMAEQLTALQVSVQVVRGPQHCTSRSSLRGLPPADAVPYCHHGVVLVGQGGEAVRDGVACSYILRDHVIQRGGVPVGPMRLGVEVYVAKASVGKSDDVADAMVWTGPCCSQRRGCGKDDKVERRGWRTAVCAAINDGPCERRKPEWFDDLFFPGSREERVGWDCLAKRRLSISRSRCTNFTYPTRRSHHRPNLFIRALTRSFTDAVSPDKLPCTS